MPAPAKERRKGILLVTAAALLWSTGGVFIKLAPMPGLTVAFGRALVTSVFYLVVLRPRLSRARVSTALAYAATVLTFVLATRLTTAANAIFLQYTGPAYVLVLAPLLLGEKLMRLDVVCVLFSLGGMSLFFIGRAEAGGAFGNAIAAASGLCFGLLILFLRRDARHEASGGDAMPSTTLGNLFAAAIALPFAAGSLRATVTPLGALVLLYLGVVQLGIGYLVFARGIRHVPASEASLVSMIEPVFNPIWVFLGTGERPGVWALCGGAIILGAVGLRTALSETNGAPPVPSPD